MTAAVRGRAPRLVAATSDRVLERDDFVPRLDRLLEAGLPAVWLRARSFDDRPFHGLAARVRATCGEAGAETWIGDRADVARLVGADAIQLPEEGLSIAGARRVVGAGIRIGRSVHSVEAACRGVAEGAQHLVVGTMYATRSHPDKVAEGPALLKSVAEAVPGTPLFAVGGITPERVAPLVRRGAHGVAAIRALWDAGDPSTAVPEFLAALEAAPGRALH